MHEISALRQSGNRHMLHKKTMFPGFGRKKRYRLWKNNFLRIPARRIRQKRLPCSHPPQQGRRKDTRQDRWSLRTRNFRSLSSPVLRLLLRSQCLADRLTGASPLQGNPLFLAAEAGGKRLSCNEAPCRSRPMQPHEPDAAKSRPLHLQNTPAYRVHRLPPPGSDKLPLPRTNAPCPAPRVPATGAAVPQGRTRFPPQSIRPLRPFPFAHRVLPRRKTPEHADMFRQYRPCDFQTGFIGDEKSQDHP